MTLEVTLRGATEPQFTRTYCNADLLLTSISLLKLLDNDGLLYAPIEKIAIIMNDTEYISIVS